MTSSQSPDRTADSPLRENTLHDSEALQHPLVRTPVPKIQLLSLCITRVVEPLTYTQIFPYVNQMVWELGVTDDPKKVGFYSGLIDSAFAFAQVFTTYGFGTLSDQIGRKPVILFGTFGISISAVLFGVSSSFIQMILARMLAGLFSGYGAVLHSALGEITDETNQAFAYTVYGLCYSAGALVGPLFGALAKPNETIPRLVPAFLHGLFDKYPYMLPSVTASAVATLSFTFALFFMKETLPPKAREKQCDTTSAQTSYGARSQTTEPTRVPTMNTSSPTQSLDTPASYESPSETDALLAEGNKPHKWTARELLKLPELRRLFRSTIFLSFLNESYVVVFVLFLYTKIQYGGLGFEPMEIGFVLATVGAVGFGLQILILPVILDRCNLQKAFKACMSLWPIGFAIPPILNTIARISSDNGQHAIGTKALVAIWVGIWIARGLVKVACMAYALNTVIARQVAPDKRALGATNGLNKLSMCAAKMIAPTFVSTLFAFSAQHNLLGGHFVWVVMVTASVVGWKTV